MTLIVSEQQNSNNDAAFPAETSPLGPAAPTMVFVENDLLVGSFSPLAAGGGFLLILGQAALDQQVSSSDGTANNH
jgi:hypothetical protein